MHDSSRGLIHEVVGNSSKFFLFSPLLLKLMTLIKSDILQMHSQIPMKETNNS